MALTPYRNFEETPEVKRRRTLNELHRQDSLDRGWRRAYRNAVRSGNTGAAMAALKSMEDRGTQIGGIRTAGERAAQLGQAQEVLQGQMDAVNGRAAKRMPEAGSLDNLSQRVALNQELQATAAGNGDTGALWARAQALGVSQSAFQRQEGLAWNQARQQPAGSPASFQAGPPAPGGVPSAAPVVSTQPAFSMAPPAQPVPTNWLTQPQPAPGSALIPGPAQANQGEVYSSYAPSTGRINPLTGKPFGYTPQQQTATTLPIPQPAQTASAPATLQPDRVLEERRRRMGLI